MVEFASTISISTFLSLSPPYVTCTDTPAPSIRVSLGPYQARCKTGRLSHSTCVHCPSNARVHRARVRWVLKKHNCRILSQVRAQLLSVSERHPERIHERRSIRHHRVTMIVLDICGRQTKISISNTKSSSKLRVKPILSLDRLFLLMNIIRFYCKYILFYFTKLIKLLVVKSNNLLKKKLSLCTPKVLVYCVVSCVFRFIITDLYKVPDAIRKW